MGVSSGIERLERHVSGARSYNELTTAQATKTPTPASKLFLSVWHLVIIQWITLKTGLGHYSTLSHAVGIYLKCGIARRDPMISFLFLIKYFCFSLPLTRIKPRLNKRFDA